MSNYKFVSIILAIIVPVICIAGPIYEDARNYAINLYNKGQYKKAAIQFVAAQDIAPVNNDITQWLSKCNSKIALQNNKKTVNSKGTLPIKQSRHLPQKANRNQNNILQDDFCSV